MFAQKVAKPQIKATEGPTNSLAQERSTLAGRGSGHNPVEQAMFLQRTIGNQATTRLLAQRGLSLDFSKIPVFPPERASHTQPSFSPPAARFAGAIQAKLEVGAVDHPLEREADRVAEQVLRMPDRSPVGLPALKNGGLPEVQRKCSCAGTCAICRTEHAADQGQGALQRNGAAPRISSMDSSSAGSQVIAPPSVQEVMMHSEGQPLAPATRAFFESRFSYDLSTVRVHADDKAAESARAINARAYTVGRRIVFGTNQYSPETVEGKRLLAHELTHSIQQFEGSERSGQAQSGTIGSSPHTRVMRAPPTGVPTPIVPHPSVMTDIGAKFEQLYSKLSPKARYRLNRDVTIAISVVTEKSDTQANSPRFVFTLSGNASSKEIDTVAEGLGMTRWKPSARTEGRGAVGSPNDAEQLVTEGAETNHFDVWGVGVNRRPCGDCDLHLKDGNVQARSFPDTAFRKGGSLNSYVPPRATKDPEPTPPVSGAAGDQGKVAKPTGKPAPTGAAPAVDTTEPKSQGATKSPTGSGAVHENEPEGGGTTPAPKSAGAAPPQAGRAAGVTIQLGTGIASLTLGLLSSYLKARVDQRIANAQIDRNQAQAQTMLNAQNDLTLQQMVDHPDQTLYARVYMTYSVVTTIEAGSTQGDPPTSASSPIVDLEGVGTTFVPLDPALTDTFLKSSGARVLTITRRLITETPLKTPPIEDLIVYGKAHKLRFDRMQDWLRNRISTIPEPVDPKVDGKKYVETVKYWIHLLDLTKDAAPRL